MSGIRLEIGGGFLPGRHAIEGYGAGGFRFADMSHRGSILILPSGISAWSVTAIDQLSQDDMDRVFAVSAGLDYFLLGCGASISMVPSDVRAAFAERAISFDAMPTAAAARTYNVLLAENRRVAAALIAVA